MKNNNSIGFIHNYNHSIVMVLLSQVACSIENNPNYYFFNNQVLYTRTTTGGIAVQAALELLQVYLLGLDHEPPF